MVMQSLLHKNFQFLKKKKVTKIQKGEKAGSLNFGVFRCMELEPVFNTCIYVLGIGYF